MKVITPVLALLLLASCGNQEESFLGTDLSPEQIQYLRTIRQSRCLNDNGPLIDKAQSNTAAAFVSIENKYLANLSNSSTLSYEQRISSKYDNEQTTTKVTEYYVVDATNTEFVLVAVDENKKIVGSAVEDTVSTNTNAKNIRIIFNQFCLHQKGDPVENGSIISLNTELNETSASGKYKKSESGLYKLDQVLPSFFSKDLATHNVTVADSTSGQLKEQKLQESTTFTLDLSPKIASISELKNLSCLYAKNELSASIDCSNASLDAIAQAIKDNQK